MVKRLNRNRINTSAHLQPISFLTSQLGLKDLRGAKELQVGMASLHTRVRYHTRQHIHVLRRQGEANYAA